MRAHTKLRAFEFASDEHDFSNCKSEIVEAEKVFGALLQASLCEL
jgi:hypothetical protein